jgi:hypothetical protein
VRNHSTSTARAIASLKAKSRWAITGTPVQNSLTDFLGLLSFLQFAPYNDPRVFDEHISNLWRTRPIEEAIDVFKRLLSCIMIRRTKAILHLPARIDKIVTLPFDNDEEQYYRNIEQPVIDMLDRDVVDSNRTRQHWTNAIQQINKLRLVCVLGVHGPSQRFEANPPIGESILTMLGARASTGGDLCGQCLQPIEYSPTSAEFGNISSAKIYYSTCEQFYCAACSVMLHYETPQPCACVPQQGVCPLLPLSSFSLTPRLSPCGRMSPSLMYLDNNPRISSKVRTLAAHVKEHQEEKQ